MNPKVMFHKTTITVVARLRAVVVQLVVAVVMLYVRLRNAKQELLIHLSSIAALYGGERCAELLNLLSDGRVRLYDENLEEQPWRLLAAQTSRVQEDQMPIDITQRFLLAFRRGQIDEADWRAWCQRLTPECDTLALLVERDGQYYSVETALYAPAQRSSTLQYDQRCGPIWHDARARFRPVDHRTDTVAMPGRLVLNVPPPVELPTADEWWNTRDDEPMQKQSLSQLSDTVLPEEPNLSQRDTADLEVEAEKEYASYTKVMSDDLGHAWSADHGAGVLHFTSGAQEDDLPPYEHHH